MPKHSESLAMKNDSTHTMYEILLAHDKLKNEVTGIRGVLAYLWRSILDNCQVSLIVFDAHTAEYIKKARQAQNAPKIANYFNRSNIFREMSRPTMTFKVFLKGLRIIGVSRIKFTVEVERKGVTTTSECNVTLTGDDANFEDSGE